MSAVLTNAISVLQLHSRMLACIVYLLALLVLLGIPMSAQLVRTDDKALSPNAAALHWSDAQNTQSALLQSDSLIHQCSRSSNSKQVEPRSEISKVKACISNAALEYVTQSCGFVQSSSSLAFFTPTRASQEETMLLIAPALPNATAALMQASCILASSRWLSRPVQVAVPPDDGSSALHSWAGAHARQLSSLVAAVVIDSAGAPAASNGASTFEVLPHAPWGKSANRDLAAGARAICTIRARAKPATQSLAQELVQSADGSVPGMQAALMAELRTDAVTVRSQSIEVLGRAAEGLIHGCSNLAAAFPHGTKVYLLLHNTYSLAGAELSVVFALLAAVPSLLALANANTSHQSKLKPLLVECCILIACALLYCSSSKIHLLHALLLVELMPRGATPASQQIACASFVSRIPCVACINMPAAVLIALFAAPARLARL